MLSAGGELPYAWFHAHSGGLTALAREGLGWDEAEPPYTQVVPGNEPESAAGEKDAQMLSEAQHWQAAFPYEEVEAACGTLGVDVSLADGAKLTIEERGDSGRAVRLGLSGRRWTPPTFASRWGPRRCAQRSSPACARRRASWSWPARATAMAWA